MVWPGRRSVCAGAVFCIALASQAGVGSASASILSTSCSAAAADVLGVPVIAANRQQAPCVDGSAATVEQTVLLPGPHPYFDSLELVGPYVFTSNNFGAPGNNTSLASVNRFQLYYEGLVITGAGAQSTANADIGACPSTAQTTGDSDIQDLTINGTSYNGTQSQTIDVPGVATITVNEQVVDGGTITRRALDVNLLALGQHVAVAESSAGASCS